MKRTPKGLRRATLRDLQQAKPGDVVVTAGMDHIMAFVKEPNRSWTSLWNITVNPIRWPGVWASKQLVVRGVYVKAAP